MNIIVYDIAALGGGGVTILDQYIERAKVDKENQWWFIIALSGYEKHETDNVHILYQKELDVRGTRRWLRRFVFEHWKLSCVVSEIKPDRVLSLQNMMMPVAKCHQTVYLHQSLQFAPVRFSFAKKEERACAIRQKIICSLIRKNLKKADAIIVQTNWMKEATAKWAKIPAAHITVQEPPPPRVSANEDNANARKKSEFFYPAGGSIYKNHQVIIDACKLLKKAGIIDYSVEFTFNASDNPLTQKMYEEIKREQLPISFVGFLPQEAVYTKYAEKTLLFPSYIETFGLPLLEAKAFNAPIIASDCPYAHDVLEGYDHCLFAQWDDAQAWADAILKSMAQCKS